MTSSITIRPANLGDAHQLLRLAVLDSTDPLDGAVLVAEDHDGEIAAAMSVATGRTIADPFKPTADLVGMLRVNAAAARERRRRSGGAARRHFAVAGLR